MASIQPRGGKFQLRIKNKVLPRPLFYTFDTLAEAEAFKAQVDGLLKQGVVPQVLMDEAQAKQKHEKATQNSQFLSAVVQGYLNHAPVAPTEAELLTVMQRDDLQGVTVADITYQWVEGYVRKLKTGRGDVRGAFGRKVGNLAPGSIRKRVGALARVMDWHWRRTVLAGEGVPPNPLRQLPRGYSVYSDKDTAEAARAGLAAKKDTTRERRLAPGEESLLLQALDGVKLPGKLRALAPDPEAKMFLRLVLDTGLRMKEAYTLRVSQIDFARGFINVEGSKGHRGSAKPRTVPLKPGIAAELRAWCTGRVGLVFGYWDGDKDSMKRTTNQLTSRFRSLFRHVELPDMKEHDLRHEACCRWFELRGKDGRWVFSDVEICKIMGWSDYSMVLRYASLRGEDLSSRLSAM